GDKRCRYAAERHRAKTLATSSVTSKVNPGRQYQAAATRVLTSGQSSFDSVKPGIPGWTQLVDRRAVHINYELRSDWKLPHTILKGVYAAKGSVPEVPVVIPLLFWGRFGKD